MKKYVMPQTDVFTTLVEQSIMVLSTVKFHEVNNGVMEQIRCTYDYERKLKFSLITANLS